MSGTSRDQNDRNAEIDDYVEKLQRDGRLLLRYIARRTDVALPELQHPSEDKNSESFNVLFYETTAVRTDEIKLAKLVQCIDELSARAAPANVRSIRLTSAYLDIAVEGKEPPPDIRAEAVRLRRYNWVVSAICVVLFLGSVAVLSHIEYGRRLLQQVNTLRVEEQGLTHEMAMLPAIESIIQRSDAPAPLKGGESTKIAISAVQIEDGDGGIPLCRRSALPKTNPVSDDLEAKKFIPWKKPATPNAFALCQKYDDLKLRLALSYMGLADWNCLTHQVISFDFRNKIESCAAPDFLPAEVDATSWQSHETWVTATSAVVAGFILPMMLGCLGGCAYVLRHTDLKLSNWTLEPHDGRHAVVRVMLAAVLGGLVGVIWSPGDNITLGGFTLSLAAIAFFVGFSVEVVFRIIENLILTFSVTLGNNPLVTPSMTRPSSNPPPRRPPAQC